MVPHLSRSFKIEPPSLRSLPVAHDIMRKTRACWAQMFLQMEEILCGPIEAEERSGSHVLGEMRWPRM